MGVPDGPSEAPFETDLSALEERLTGCSLFQRSGDAGSNMGAESQPENTAVSQEDLDMEEAGVQELLSLVAEVGRGADMDEQVHR